MSKNIIRKESQKPYQNIKMIGGMTRETRMFKTKTLKTKEVKIN